MSAWVCLVIAGLFEAGWALGLRASEGFTRPWPSFFTVVGLAASMYLLARSLLGIPLGTAYAVWVGIGVIGTTVAGAALFGEAMSPTRAFCLLLLVVAVVGLKVTAPS